VRTNAQVTNQLPNKESSSNYSKEELVSNKDEWTAGYILWQDLTVSNAIKVRDFYREIIGWDCIPEDMGGYDDFHMVIPPSGNSVAGICHARGENADPPPVWLIYIAVEKCRKKRPVV